jgi:ABC-2 type transport system ATP-binding protein
MTTPPTATGTDPPLLAVEGLVVRYGPRTVLDGLSFRVARGEIFGLLGPNGSGKSTTFSVLTGLVPPVAGALRLEGEPIAAGDRRLRARLGVVFQQPSLDVRLSARENLSLGAALYGLRGAEARARIEALLAFAELRERGDEPVSRFSGGMRRRLELVRALVHQPDVLLMDEPTTGLDEMSFQRTWARIEELRRTEKLTVILTTHRPEEAERCDRLAVVSEGRVVAEDAPERLKARVSGDVITLEARDPETVAGEVRVRFGLEATVAEGAVVIERERGHELIPRLVEAFPAGALASVAMRRPSLADAFLKLTGRALGATQQQPATTTRTRGRA